MQNKIVLVITTVFMITGFGMLDTQAQDGQLRYSISVSEFRNEASWRGKWNVGDGFATILTDVLNQTGRFIVLGDSDMRQAAMAEQDLAASGRTAGGRMAPQTGRMTPAQLLVRGSITHVQETGGGRGGINFRGINIGGSRASAEVNVTMYLVDSQTGQVVASQNVTGTSGRRGIGVGYSGSELGGLTGNLSGFTDDNVGKACEDAVAEGVKFMIEQLADIRWQGSVMMVRDNRIIINRGTREGVNKGMRFEVGGIEELIDPDTGEVLDSHMTIIGELEADDVRERITYCKILSGSGIEQGMAVFAK